MYHGSVSIDKQEHKNDSTKMFINVLILISRYIYYSSFYDIFFENKHPNTK